MDDPLSGKREKVADRLYENPDARDRFLIGTLGQNPEDVQHLRGVEDRKGDDPQQIEIYATTTSLEELRNAGRALGYSGLRIALSRAIGYTTKRWTKNDRL